MSPPIGRVRGRLAKTIHRTTMFLRAALAFRAPEREHGMVAWALLGGAVVGGAFLPATGAALPAALGGLYLLVLLSMVCAIDARYGIIPDEFVIALSIGGVGLTALADLPAAIVGVLLVLLAGYLLQYAYRLWRGFDGLGGGDVKFLAAACLWVGLDGVPWVLLIGVGSALMTLAQMRLARNTLSRHDALAFGPHLAVGLWLTWLVKLLQA